MWITVTFFNNFAEAFFEQQLLLDPYFLFTHKLLLFLHLQCHQQFLSHVILQNTSTGTFSLMYLIVKKEFPCDKIICKFPRSSPCLLFNRACVYLYVKVPNHIYVLKWYIIHYLIYFRFIECLYTFVLAAIWWEFLHCTKLSYQLELCCQINLCKSSFTYLRHFPNFSFVCFYRELTWFLGKVKKKVKTEGVSNWTDAQSSCFGFRSFNVAPCLLPKLTVKILS